MSNVIYYHLFLKWRDCVILLICFLLRWLGTYFYIYIMQYNICCSTPSLLKNKYTTEEKEKDFTASSSSSSKIIIYFYYHYSIWFLIFCSCCIRVFVRPSFRSYVWPPLLMMTFDDAMIVTQQRRCKLTFISHSIIRPSSQNLKEIIKLVVVVIVAGKKLNSSIVLYYNKRTSKYPTVSSCCSTYIMAQPRFIPFTSNYKHPYIVLIVVRVVK